VRFISPLLKRVVYPCLASAGYFRQRARHGHLCVVTYHGVRPGGYESIDPALDGSLISAEALRSQLRLLKAGYNVVSAEDVFQWLERDQTLPVRSVLLTCDDGLQSCLTDMVPVLRDEGLSCLFFVTAASLDDNPQMLWYEELYLLLLAAPAGEICFHDLDFKVKLGAPKDLRPLWWTLVKRLSRHDARKRSGFLKAAPERLGLARDWQAAHQNGPARLRFNLLTCMGLRQLEATGMFVGAHTLSHPVLSEATAELAWSEIADSRAALQTALGKPVWAMAYPFGDPASVTARELELVERAGYQCAFINCRGGFGAKIPRFAIPRVHVTADMTLGEFEAHISGFHEWLRQRVARQDSVGCGIP